MRISKTDYERRRPCGRAHCKRENRDNPTDAPHKKQIADAYGFAASPFIKK
jgi:hypothetical protein